MYIPPFTVSAEAINLIANISGQIERYAIRLEQEDGLRLTPDNTNPVDKEFGVKFGAKFGAKFGLRFGANEKQLLLLLSETPGITAQEIAQHVGISKRGVEKQLKKLKDAGVISREGSDKSGYWVINKED